MKKIKNSLSALFFLLLSVMFSISKVYADLLPTPRTVTGGNDVIIEAGVGVVALAIISWLVIRHIRKK